MAVEAQDVVVAVVVVDWVGRGPMRCYEAYLHNRKGSEVAVGLVIEKVRTVLVLEVLLLQSHATRRHFSPGDTYNLFCL